MGNCAGKKQSNQHPSNQQRTTVELNLQNENQEILNQDHPLAPPIEQYHMWGQNSILLEANSQEITNQNRKKEDSKLRISILKKKLFPEIEQNLRKSLILSRREMNYSKPTNQDKKPQ